MKYLLDTDHLSILQRQTGKDYTNLSACMVQHPLSDFAVSIITFHEQVLGCHAYVNCARGLDEVTRGYKMMAHLISDFRVLPLISFDTDAAMAFDQLQVQRIQLATMDARIAAIALSRRLTLLTRNHRDYSRVPELAIEDWTVRLRLS